MFYTYFHTRNDTGEVFYVGKGKGGRAHAKGRNPHWDRIAAKHGHTVHIASRWKTEPEAFEHEKFLISCFRDMGVGLTNCTDGGEGVSGLVHSEESRAKMSLSQTGKLVSDDTRRKLSVAMLGNDIGEVGRKKISLALTGRPKSAEVCAHHSLAMCGNDFALGNILSDETRLKMSKSASVRKWSDETKAKMSASAKTRWALKKVSTP